MNQLPTQNQHDYTGIVSEFVGARHTNRTGTLELTFKLAVTDRWARQNEEEHATRYILVVAYGIVAENLAAMFHRYGSAGAGMHLMVFGKARTDDARTGGKRVPHVVAKAAGPDLRYHTALIVPGTPEPDPVSAQTPAARPNLVAV
ncbi:MAG TPA: hypothetical protein VGL46_11975 [Pseudonocardiaceae bacterium]